MIPDFHSVQACLQHFANADAIPSGVVAAIRRCLDISLWELYGSRLAVTVSELPAYSRVRKEIQLLVTLPADDEHTFTRVRLDLTLRKESTGALELVVSNEWLPTIALLSTDVLTHTLWLHLLHFGRVEKIPTEAGRALMDKARLECVIDDNDVSIDETSSPDLFSSYEDGTWVRAWLLMKKEGTDEEETDEDETQSCDSKA